ncbi:unnamed protein product [Mycena citricolor]|uniref:Uncharacterized protein n=1 Tax=Mycena citricolor TaxID=2018698 RepID=A0AAD2H4Z1_9AGAR|nr:unnamed protein product [Mycena citricolor]
MQDIFRDDSYEGSHFALGPRGSTLGPRDSTRSLRDAKAVTTTQHVVDGGAYAGLYILKVFKGAIMLLRIPLTLLLFLWMLVFLFGAMTHTISAAFQPLCWIRGLSSFVFCASASPLSAQDPPKWADFPSLVSLQTTTMEQLLDESSSGSFLALQMKKAEMATTDLVTLVRVSDLMSRDTVAICRGETDFGALRKRNAGNTETAVMLCVTLETSLETPPQTSENEKMSTKGPGPPQAMIEKIEYLAELVNNHEPEDEELAAEILAVNDYALRTIEAAEEKFVAALWKQLIPWKKSNADVVLDAFEASMNYLSFTLQQLVVEFETNLHNLNKLEEQLTILHEIVTREDISLSAAKSELLSNLWTILGGNRRQLRGYESHLDLLSHLGSYRRQALVHVVSALQTLTQMGEDIENLRERVAAPELTGGRIPAQVHMKGIQNGLERIKEGRAKAKEKETHAVRRIVGGLNL